MNPKIKELLERFEDRLQYGDSLEDVVAHINRLREWGEKEPGREIEVTGRGPNHKVVFGSDEWYEILEAAEHYRDMKLL